MRKLILEADPEVVEERKWVKPTNPAVVSAPLITTLVDATGLIIYYSIAIVVLLKLGL